MSPTLMSDIQNGNLQMFSSKYQEQKFWDIMSTKTYIFLFSRVLKLSASINCDPQSIVYYFYERKTFVY